MRIDLRVFLSIDQEEQIRRIRSRNGNEAVFRFRDCWIPLEEQHFSSFSEKGLGIVGIWIASARTALSVLFGVIFNLGVIGITSKSSADITALEKRQMEDGEDLARIFAEQLENCGVDYFDLYIYQRIMKDYHSL